MRTTLSVLVITAACYGHASAADSRTDVEDRFARAQQFEEEGKFEDAEAIYRALLADDPTLQKAAAKLAMCLFDAGLVDEAADAADAAIAIAPYRGVWAERAYLYKARACAEAGCLKNARDAVEFLRERFPDAVSTTRAEVVEARLDGRDPGLLEAAIQVEMEADELHDAANQAVKGQDYEQGLALLDSLIANYPDTRRALRGRMTRAYLLGMMPGRTDDCLSAWQDVHHRTEIAAPRSAIHLESLLRSGFLLQRLDRRAEAYVNFSAAAALADEPNLAADAKLQSAGAYFEVLQRQLFTEAGVSPQEWSELRERCGEVRANPSASEEARCRAELMVLESFDWEFRPEDSWNAAAAFLAKYNGGKLLPEQAAAHLFAGRSLQRLNRHAEALPHFQWILDTFPDGEVIWEGIDYHAMAYYGVFVCHMYSDAPYAEMIAPCLQVLKSHADSEEAALCRIAVNDEGLHDAHK